uniref:Phosphoribulokinase/uridine kinase domain-containing protein n=1 Tax=Eutreptiella gymnastica TaxID=73025 RepID=A0A7S1J0Z7_9EUGL|mmetsp:Transcript_58261/g.103961  ORF Transcript_58261/g.103961 Transcript_58261/m.103961 type:complete len:1296 (+) Transcript_58261:88-3975(+)
MSGAKGGRQSTVSNATTKSTTAANGRKSAELKGASDEDAAYLSKHKIPAKVEQLMSALLKSKTEDPLGVMKETLNLMIMKAARANKGDASGATAPKPTIHSIFMALGAEDPPPITKKKDGKDGKDGKDNNQGKEKKKEEKISLKGLIGAKVGGVTVSLWKELHDSETPVPIYTHQPDGNLIYRRSVVFLLAMACNSLWPGRQLTVEHAFSLEDTSAMTGYYCTLKLGAIKGVEGVLEEFTMTQVTLLIEEMLALVEVDLPITEVLLDTTHPPPPDWGMGPYLTVLAQNAVSPALGLHKCGTFVALRQWPLAASTGLLKYFELQCVDEGFVLRVPTPQTPQHCPVYTALPVLFDAHASFREWGTCVGLDCIGDLNKAIRAGKGRDVVGRSEALQGQQVLRIAREIVSRFTSGGSTGTGAVVVAGAIDSGRKTLACRLSIVLTALGLPAAVFSTDDYYRKDQPSLHGPERVIDLANALRLDQMYKDMAKLFEGEEVHVPVIDPITGRLQSILRPVQLPHAERNVLIIEGLHVLNPQFLRYVPTTRRYSVYVSPICHIKADNINWVSSQQVRLLRHVHQNVLLRGHPIEEAVASWARGRQSDELNLIPYLNSLDSVFNSAVDFELSVLKTPVAPLLSSVGPDSPNFEAVLALRRLLLLVDAVPQKHIPNWSVLREFLGGSVFDLVTGCRTAAIEDHPHTGSWVDLSKTSRTESQASVWVDPLAPPPRTVMDLIRAADLPTDYDRDSVIAAYVNEEMVSLSARVTHDQAYVKPIYGFSTDGKSVYRQTLCFVLHVAAKRLFPDRTIHVRHGFGLEETGFAAAYMVGFAPGQPPMTLAEMGEIKEMMGNMISQDLPIKVVEKTVVELMRYFQERNEEYSEAFCRSTTKASLVCSELDGYLKMNLTCPMAPSTRHVRTFDLRPLKTEFILCFPNGEERGKGGLLTVPSNIARFEEGILSPEYFQQQQMTGEILGFHCVGDLNAKTHESSAEVERMVHVSEAIEERTLITLAERITDTHADTKLELVTVSGFAGSGKTSIAKHLSAHLMALGMKPVVLSTGDYYKSHTQPDYPRRADVVLNSESKASIDTGRLQADLRSLLSGKEVVIPIFDKASGRSFPYGRAVQMETGGIIILEGPWSSAEEVTGSVLRKHKFKIQINATPRCHLDEITWISGTVVRECRMIARARLVHHRSLPEALVKWRITRDKEDRNQFPFRDVDVVIPCTADFELPVLRAVVLPLLDGLRPEHSDQATHVAHLRRLLGWFHPFNGHFIPSHSPLRGFIGGLPPPGTLPHRLDYLGP